MSNVDLRTSYLGLTLPNPLVLAASPLTATISSLEQYAAVGVGAAVLTSIFEEHIRADQLTTLGGSGDAASVSSASQDSAFRELGSFTAGVDAYLRQIELARKTLSVPVIGSMNGSHAGEWVRFAKHIESAGADALELNAYFVPIDPEVSGSQVEQQYLDLVAAVRAEIRIPLAVKLGPYFSSLPHFARRLVAAGANGLVLFNRYLQPDIDVQTHEIVPHLEFSHHNELRQTLRWIGILRGQTDASLAATSGVQTADDVIKAVLAGADVVMVASALIQYGTSRATEILNGLTSSLDQKGVQKLSQIRGLSSQQACSNPATFERANYGKTLASYHNSGAS